jgi:hypothetical protein
MEEKEFDITSYFYDSIELLRTSGNIVLHSKFIQVSEDEQEYVTQFLSKDFENEELNFPGKPPKFDAKAALWGAKSIFIASQLLMLRDISETEFPELLPIYTGEVDESAMMSCDMCLKFLPEIIEQAEDIDTYDGLIPHLEKLLAPWCYSGIGRRLIDPSITFSNIDVLKSHPMQILTVDRVVQRKAHYRIPQEIKEIVKPYIEIGLNE